MQQKPYPNPSHFFGGLGVVGFGNGVSGSSGSGSSSAGGANPWGLSFIKSKRVATIPNSTSKPVKKSTHSVTKTRPEKCSHATTANNTSAARVVRHEVKRLSKSFISFGLILLLPARKVMFWICRPYLKGSVFFRFDFIQERVDSDVVQVNDSGFDYLLALTHGWRRYGVSEVYNCVRGDGWHIIGWEKIFSVNHFADSFAGLLGISLKKRTWSMLPLNHDEVPMFEPM